MYEMTNDRIAEDQLIIKSHWQIWNGYIITIEQLLEMHQYQIIISDTDSDTTFSVSADIEYSSEMCEILQRF